MSSYKNYDLKSRVYGKTGSAVGSEIILKLLSRIIAPLDRRCTLSRMRHRALYGCIINKLSYGEDVDCLQSISDLHPLSGPS